MQKVKLALFRALLALLGKLPLTWRTKLGTLLGLIVSLVPTPERRVALLQIKRFLPERNANAVLRGVYSSLGQTVLENLNMRPLLDNLDAHVHVRDRALLQDLASSKRGLLILSAHTANWELLAATGVKGGLKVSVVGRHTRIPLLHEILVELRESYGVDTIWRTKGAPAKMAGLEIMRLMKRGKAVAALIDQDTRVESIFVPFFGVPVKTPASIIELAQQAEARIIVTFIVRIAPQQYEVRAEELDASQPAEQIAIAYNNALEKIIREFPEQWVWFHKRWRSTPDGHTMSTKEYLEALA